MSRTFAPGLFTNQPITFIEGALQRFALVQDEYTKGHDAIDAIVAADVIDRAQLVAVRTPEFNEAHATTVWALDTIEGNMAELGRRIGTERAAAWLADKAARYGVRTPLVRR